MLGLIRGNKVIFHTSKKNGLKTYQSVFLKKKVPMLCWLQGLHCQCAKTNYEARNRLHPQTKLVTRKSVFLAWLFLFFPKKKLRYCDLCGVRVVAIVLACVQKLLRLAFTAEHCHLQVVLLFLSSSI